MFIVIIAAVWLALIVVILMFFHGASKLRHQARHGRVRHGNVPRAWPVRRRHRVDMKATVAYLPRERKGGGR